MSLSPARRTALDAITEIRRRGAYARPVVDAVVAASRLSPGDAALATRLSYGAVLAEGTLDAIIDEHAKRPGAVEPRVRDALRLSIYELLFLRTPSRAAVHQGVEAVRRIRPAAAGFANAVLRRVALRAETFPWGDPTDDLDALARAAAMPRWMVDLFVRDLGPEHAHGALMAGLDAAPLYVRVNPFHAQAVSALERLRQDGAEPTPTPPDDLALECMDPAAAVRGTAISDGLVVVSDAAAQVAPLVCAPRPGQTVLDVGAGRGTKSAVLQGIAHRNGGISKITALDIHAFKLERLTETMRSLGVDGVQTVVADATDADALRGIGVVFDIVLVDAPCSGLGTLRRHPEKRWRLHPDDIPRIAELQSDMLAAAASVVRPGGLVVYSTCTITRDENEDVVEGFLSAEGGRDFSVKSVNDVVPDAWGHFVTSEGFFRSWPTHDGPDGHFVAALRRT